VVTGSKEMVRCTFCGADLSIEDESGQAAFRVINQPEPQKETLSKPVEGRGEPSAAARVYAEPGMAETPARPPMQFDAPTPSFEPDLVSSGANVYPAGTERKGFSGTNRWILIGGAAFLGLLLLCACGAIALMAAMRGNF
jgi:hypothetical protein